MLTRITPTRLLSPTMTPDAQPTIIFLPCQISTDGGLTFNRLTNG